MKELFTLVFYQPILNLLVFFYNIIPGHDIGLAIILITVLIKLILHPFSVKSLKSQKALQELQPKIEAIKAKYKDQKEVLAAEMMKLYKNEKVSPFSSCLPLLIQFPFLIAVYQVFSVGLSNKSLSLIYPFIANPGTLSPIAFGLLDFSKHNIVLALITGVAQYWQTKMLMQKKPAVKSIGAADENIMAIMKKQMTILMPAMTAIIGASLPSGLVFYWLVLTVLTGWQQLWTFRRDQKQKIVN